MSPTIDRAFAEAVERELAAIGTPRSRLQKHQRRTRTAAIAFGSLALAGALTGAAVAVAGLPGQTTVTPFEQVVTGTYTGTAAVELGPIPEGADRVILDLTCSNGGSIEVAVRPGQAGTSATTSWDCSDAVRGGKATHVSDALLPSPGSTSITITADPRTTWTVTARYGTSETSDWGVNANGETYGVPNDKGVPDLIAARATNGEDGYIRDSDTWAVEGCINVYESDGETVVGLFPNGAAEGECDADE
jgi:hypothetical protein